MRDRCLVVMACSLLGACAAGDNGVPREGSEGGGAFDGAGAGQSGGGSFQSDGFGNAATSGQGGTEMRPDSIGDPGSGCPHGRARTARVKPTVHLVIDGSGSMEDDFGGVSRWQALRSALMDDDGIVPTLESTVEFGMVLYDGAVAGGVLGGVSDLLDTIIPGLGVVIPQPGDDECPRIVSVAPALDNRETLDQAYPGRPLGGSTPTHSALQAAMANAAMQVENAPDQERGPQYVVLATDGEPNDLCAGDLAGDVRPAVIVAVEQGASQNVKTFVISLAGQDAALQAHLEEVAAVGGTGEPPFTPMSKDDLVAVLTDIIGGAVTCQVRLSGEVQVGSECLGVVEVNGNKLPCNDPDGWKLADENTIELTGQACADFRVNPEALLRAEFPCDVFRPE